MTENVNRAVVVVFVLFCFVCVYFSFVFFFARYTFVFKVNVCRSFLIPALRFDSLQRARPTTDNR